LAKGKERFPWPEAFPGAMKKGGGSRKGGLKNKCSSRKLRKKRQVLTCHGAEQGGEKDLERDRGCNLLLNKVSGLESQGEKKKSGVFRIQGKKNQMISSGEFPTHPGGAGSSLDGRLLHFGMDLGASKKSLMPKSRRVPRIKSGPKIQESSGTVRPKFEAHRRSPANSTRLLKPGPRPGG